MRIIGFILSLIASCWHWWAGLLVYGIFYAIAESIGEGTPRPGPESTTSGQWYYHEEYSQQSSPEPNVNQHGGAYRRLGLSPDCSDKEVKKAYRKMAQQFHPDKYEGCDERVREQATREFIEINEAYEAIKTVRNIV